MLARKPYRNASEAVIDMHERGFVEDFVLCNWQLLWIQPKLVMTISEITVVESYRFFLPTARTEVTTIHGIATVDRYVNGILINHFSVDKIDNDFCYDKIEGLAPFSLLTLKLAGISN